MSKNLLLRLPKDNHSAVHWLVYTREGDGVNALESGSLSSIADLHQLTEKTAQCRVTVLVPGELVTFHQVKVSGRLTANVKKSLVWRLEDDISSDVEDLHVAILGRTGDDVHLGVIEHCWMSFWFDLLAEAGIESRQWLPDTLALPWQQGQCTQLTVANDVLVRHNQWQGACCDQNWLPLFMESLSENNDLEIVDLSGIESESYLTILADGVHSQTANLLQERWTLQSSGKNRLKPWRLSMTLALLFLCSWLGTSLLSAWQMSNAADQRQLQARKVYQQLFPGERVIRLLPQMNRKMRELEAGQEPDDGVLQQLDYLAPAFKQFPDIKPVLINYDDGRQILRITAEASSMASFTGMRDSIAGDKTVELDSLEQKGDRITGVLIIRGDKS